jgi:hypothetical protein
MPFEKLLIYFLLFGFLLLSFFWHNHQLVGVPRFLMSLPSALQIRASFFSDGQSVFAAGDVAASGGFAGPFFSRGIFTFVFELPGDVTRGFILTVRMLLVLILDSRLGIRQAALTFLFDRHDIS